MFNRSRSKYTYLQKASYISFGSVIVIKNKPCEVRTFEETRHINYSFEKTRDISYSSKLKFVAHDIFDGKEYTLQVKADGYCECPYVYDTEYEITHISTDGRLSLITENGEVRAPLSLSLAALPQPHEPPNDPRCHDDCGDDCHLDFLTQHIKRFREGKLLFADVKFAMGREQVCGIIERPG
ncbi:eukaryotic translation initiation factor 5A-1 [Artemisia annua]|uniref:Eukaryotic translation initiation factor 5A-1 n=1 Tax=Artemisia annua TaxID=35608 RepID=A0A2U1MBY3_ARTAN|nr:eukaryotic translation initiation factor 5A-1 [Artemisia annua]